MVATATVAAIIGAIVTAACMVIARNLSSPEKKIRYAIDPDCSAGDAQFVRAMSNMLGPPLLDGNRVTPLQNGAQIFPAMLEAIRCARKTVTFETFIYWSGSTGKRFAEAIIERAHGGVRVHVLLDWLGAAKIDHELVQQMEAAGVEVVRYHPVRWYTLDRLNNRTHRKILVVDGCIGFTGGVGIADKWDGEAQDEDHWRDSHYRIEGPAVAQMQAAFMDNWTKTRARVLQGDGYFPPLEPCGTTVAQVFRSSPRGGSESVRLMYLLAIASARKSILIGNAYFVPDDLLVESLVSACKRSVRIQIIVPGMITDTSVVRRASRACWGPLLKAGAQIHEFQPTMYHTKLFIVDGVWTSVGSTNFDNRSFRLNDEVNMNVLDEPFAAGETETFQADLLRSREITFAEWARRPWPERLKERAASLIRSQL